MRISDWSSDVCSSDLDIPARERKDEIGSMAGAVQVFKDNAIEMERVKTEHEEAERQATIAKKRMMNELASSFEAKVGSDRKSVMEGKRGSVRVDFGGRSIIKTKQK